MSAANADDKLVAIRAKFGMWGVGCYWTILELVAAQMKLPDNRPIAVLYRTTLCSFLGCKGNKLDSFLDHSRNETGMIVKCSGNIIEIEIPKLLEIKDNYHDDLEVSGKKLGVEEEEEEDKRLSPSVCPSACGATADELFTQQGGA
jgi:hypothetical protein